MITSCCQPLTFLLFIQLNYAKSFMGSTFHCHLFICCLVFLQIFERKMESLPVSRTYDRGKKQLKIRGQKKKKERKKAYLSHMELAREVVISWRELKGKPTKYTTTTDHPPSERSLVAVISLICHIAIPALPTYTHTVKDKAQMTKITCICLIMLDCAWIDFGHLLFKSSGTLPQRTLTRFPLL